MRIPWLLFISSFVFAGIFGVFSIAGVSAVLFLLWWIRENRIQGTLEKMSPTSLSRGAHFLYDFAKDLVVSNLIMAWDVLVPRDLHKVSLVRVPIEDLSEPEIAFLSHRITLTPGTLACAVTTDRRFLLVHVMYPSRGSTGQALRKPIDILKGTLDDGN
ncbi:MAG: Na+/H+ antiporter subunit E [Candidatus Omnitrophica bacterium]|nr:Na+/H+ antiporter subunit E [Candidatus Omnitrophota bacterium]MCA9435037.1 Na+/H+ antiporter subunit E [Candidatus Omnitrophota bacterium]